MTIPLFHVDAFTDRPFAGNPAAVCLLPSWKEDRWLQAVAREMNLSETAFLVKQPDHFDLRWFTPKVEVDLCGHATLASAHVLWQQGQATGDEIRFSTRSGILKAMRHGDDIELDFPLKPEEAAEAPPRPPRSCVGHFSPTTSARTSSTTSWKWTSEAALRDLPPISSAWRRCRCEGSLSPARSADPRFDFVSGVLRPGVRRGRRPGDGSAHCCLGDFWRKRLGKSGVRGVSGVGQGRRGEGPGDGGPGVPGRKGRDGGEGRVVCRG